MNPMYDDDDEKGLGSLLDALEGMDAKSMMSPAPSHGATIVELHIHPNGKDAPMEEAPSMDDDEGMLPTPEELEEMMKGIA